MSVAVPVIDYMDVTTKRIYLLQGVTEYHPVEDIYKEVRNLRKTDESLRVVSMPVFAFGNIAKGGGKYTPRYAQFNNGWRVIPYDELSTLYISGEQITDDGQSGPACIDMTSLVSAVTIHYEPPAAEIVRDEVSLAAIARMSFNNQITVDVITGDSIASFTGDPTLLGNNQYPVNNFEDARIIAENKSLRDLHIIGDATLADVNLTGYRIIGNGAIRCMLTLEPSAILNNVLIHDATVTGTLDGGTFLERCFISGINYFNGLVYNCAFDHNPVYIRGTAMANFFDCKGASDIDALITFDCEGSSAPLTLRNFSGCFQVVNRNVASTSCLNFTGECVLDSTCIIGDFDISGNGDLIDNTTGMANVLKRKLTHPDEIVERVWATDDAKKLLNENLRKAVISPDDQHVIIYEEDGVTVSHEFDISADKRTRTPV